MAIIVGNQPDSKEYKNFNDELRKIKGELSDEEARIVLAKYLRYNLGITVELLTGIKLAPYQIMTINAWFNRNFNMAVWSRGGAKSFCAAIFCFLYCIFEPGAKILIASSNFRTSRRIFEEIEKMCLRADATLLCQCLGVSGKSKNPNKQKRADQFRWLINGGSIEAIPLSGERIRGIRANVLILDEFLLLPQEIIDTVLIPFLMSPQDLDERNRIREEENDLIKAGQLREDQRMQFANTAKMIALSSASYTFEHLYKVYERWSALIDNPDLAKEIYKDVKDSKVDTEQRSTYFISQLSYEALPTHFVDSAAIEVAKNGGSSDAAFQREYCARFIDGGDSYFSPLKMNACSYPAGEEPASKLVGEKGKKYIIAIDPNVSSAKNSDYFAIAVMEINADKKCTLVHAFQLAGATYQETIKYFFYLYTNFDTEMIIIDNIGGDQFIAACNSSHVFQEAKIKLGFFEFDSNKEGLEYEEMVKEARKGYNKDLKMICLNQIFEPKWIARANHFLQSCIDHKRIWFAAPAAAHANFLDMVQGTVVPLNHIFIKGEGSKADNPLDTSTLCVGDLYEQVDFVIRDTKDQCSLIEVSTNASGGQTFDLPANLKRLTSETRPRRDNYTALLLGNWGVKVYNDLMQMKEVKRVLAPPIAF